MGGVWTASPPPTAVEVSLGMNEDRLSQVEVPPLTPAESLAGWLIAQVTRWHVQTHEEQQAPRPTHPGIPNQAGSCLDAANSLLGSGNTMHPMGLHQPALQLSHRTPLPCPIAPWRPSCAVTCRATGASITVCLYHANPQRAWETRRSSEVHLFKARCREYVLPTGPRPGRAVGRAPSRAPVVPQASPT